MMFKVLVCGGRDYRNRAFVFYTLDVLADKHGDIHIINGGAGGADRLAVDWAFEKKMSWTSYCADWGKHGKAAGPIRNRQMLEEGKPDLVVAFPGGRGTANMVKQAEEAGITVKQWY